MKPVIWLAFRVEKLPVDALLVDALLVEKLPVDAFSVERFNGSLTLPPVKLIVVIPATVANAMSAPPTRLGDISAVSVVAVMSPLADIFEKDELPAVS